MITLFRNFLLFKKLAGYYKKFFRLKYIALVTGFIAGALVVRVLGHKVVLGGVVSGLSSLLFVAKWGISLVILYSLLWFLFSALTFIASKGKAPAFQMTTAAILGTMTTICHAIIYVLWWR